MNLKITFGDLLYRKKGLVEHVGIYLGNNKVVHNSPDGNIQTSSIEEYAQNKNIKVVTTNFDNIALLEQRLNAILSTGNTYNLLAFNCEQFAYQLILGKNQSPQIRATVIGALTGLIAGQYFNQKHSFWFTLAGAAVGCIIANNNRSYDEIVDVSSESHDDLKLVIS